MTVAAHVRMRVSLLVATLLVAAAAPTFALPPDHPAMKLLYKARTAIDSGNAANAATPLEEVRKLFPRTPEADEAQRLLDKIASLEVLLDRSHEWRGETHTVGRYLKNAGIGVAVSDASLEHLKDRLDTFEMILIWQENASVSFTDAEIVLLKNWLKEGGRLLVIGTTRPQGPYPLVKLLASLGCPLRGPQVTVNFGKGQVKFFENAGLFEAARLADARESEQEVVEIFRRLMPYEQLARSPLSETVPPEKTEMVGPVKIEFSARLDASAERMKDLLGKLQPQITVVYNEEVPKGLTVQLLPRAWSSWMGGEVFATGTMQTPAEVARETARALALWGLFPEAKWISYPPWVTNGWCDLVALRAVYKIGYKREAEEARTQTLAAWKFDPLREPQIDLAVSRLGGSTAYIAKSQWMLEQLEKRHGKDLLAKFRKELKEYAAAGRVTDSMSTRNTLYFLSQALHADMFAFFQTHGTTVLPIKLDYYELEKARGVTP